MFNDKENTIDYGISFRYNKQEIGRKDDLKLEKLK